MHSKAGCFASHSTRCIELLVCAGPWLVCGGCKDQSERVPDMPLYDAHRPGAVVGLDQSSNGLGRQGRSNG